MAEGFTLLDVSVEPTRGVNDIIKEAFEAIKSGLKKSDTKLIHAFKIVGENRFVIVAQGDPDHALHEMNERHGEKLRVVSTPLRSYFSFAEKTLGVKKELLPTEIKDLSPGGSIYYQHAVVTYDGMTIECLKDCWNREASIALPALKEANVEISLFKTVLQKDVHCFLKNGPDEADQVTWTVPMWREMGNKISSVCKPIKHMSELFG